jgi:hypothetical protein
VTAKVGRNPARKTRKDLVGETMWRLKAREAELRAMPLDDVLAELGRVVNRYTVTPALAWDGRSDADRAQGGRERPEPDGRLLSYAVSYEMYRPGRPMFCCGGRGPEFFWSLHEAAVWALMGALAWLGAFREDAVAS